MVIVVTTSFGTWGRQQNFPTPGETPRHPESSADGLRCRSCILPLSFGPRGFEGSMLHESMATPRVRDIDHKADISAYRRRQGLTGHATR